MGGCTITLVGDTEQELLSRMKQQILGACRAGLWVDSELCIINPEKKESKMFNVEYAPLGTEIKFTEVKEGRIFHVGVAGKFGKKPEKGQLVATVHAHT